MSDTDMDGATEGNTSSVSMDAAVGNARDVDVLALRLHLLERVERTTQNVLMSGSKRNYNGSIMRYLVWLHTTGERVLGKRLLSDEFRSGITGDKPTVAYMQSFLAKTPRVSPIDFEIFQGSDFTIWLAALQDAAEADSGKLLSHSTMGGHRSALRFLFSENKHDVDDYTDGEYRKFFCGLKRDTATTQGNGVGKVLTGKLPLTFCAYSALCGSFLSSGALEDVFAHCFLTLQWNLMCRSASTASICFPHVAWRNDAMGIVFPRMKNDQSGERPREPRHIYANPTNPTVCPILSTAVYFLCFPSIGGSKFFPGESQTERFRKRMHTALSRPPLSTLLSELGLSPDDIGTHSIRKGSATYCSSGSTACPSTSSVRVRAGWSTGAVYEMYCQYECAGDQHVGRTAAGLPVDQPEFAILPPHFSDLTDDVIAAVVSTYPSLHRLASSVAQFCLASLVYHDDFLESYLPAAHPVRHTRYFENAERKRDLSRFVTLHSGVNGNVLRATGVPPHVNMQVSLKTMTDELRELISAVHAIPDAVVAQIAARPSDEQPLARADLRETMTSLLTDVGFFEMLSRFGNAAPDLLKPHPAPVVSQNPASVTMLRAIDGGLARDTPIYRLPSGSLQGAWQRWFFGDHPLRYATGHDMSSHNEKKRLSDLRFLMTKLNERVPGFPRSARPSDADVDAAFRVAVDGYTELLKTPSGGPRRIDQVRWASAATFLRAKRR